MRGDCVRSKLSKIRPESDFGFFSIVKSVFGFPAVGSEEKKIGDGNYGSDFISRVGSGFSGVKNQGPIFSLDIFDPANLGPDSRHCH